MNNILKFYKIIWIIYTIIFFYEIHCTKHRTCIPHLLPRSSLYIITILLLLILLLVILKPKRALSSIHARCACQVRSSGSNSLIPQPSALAAHITHLIFILLLLRTRQSATLISYYYIWSTLLPPPSRLPGRNDLTYDKYAKVWYMLDDRLMTQIAAL